MKTLFIAVLFLFGTVANAANCRHGEAQVIGYAKAVQISGTTCSALLSENSQVTPSPYCPIDEGRLYQQGVEFNLTTSGKCPVSTGDSISGIIIDNGFSFSLE